MLVNHVNFYVLISKYFTFSIFFIYWLFLTQKVRLDPTINFFFLFFWVSFNVKEKQMGWSVVHLEIGFQTTYGFINLIIISLSLYLSFKGVILTYNTTPTLRATLCQTIIILFFFSLNQILFLYIYSFSFLASHLFFFCTYKTTTIWLRFIILWIFVSYHVYLIVGNLDVEKEFELSSMKFVLKIILNRVMLTFLLLFIEYDIIHK